MSDASKLPTGDKFHTLWGQISPLRRRLRDISRLPQSHNAGVQAVYQALNTSQLRQLSQPEQAWLTQVEAQRTALAHDTTPITATFQDPQTGEMITATNTVQNLLNRGSISPNWGRFLFGLVRALKPQVSVELGTYLGVSALYQAAALDLNASEGVEGRLYAVDQLEPLLEVAQRNLDALSLSRVDLKAGMFLESLDGLLPAIGPLDFVFYDGSHKAEPTRLTLAKFWPHVAPGGLVLFDDINWNEGMRRLWPRIQALPDVAAVVDLGRQGICIKGQPQMGRQPERYYLHRLLLSPKFRMWLDRLNQPFQRS